MSLPLSFIKQSHLRGTLLVALSGILYGAIGYFGTKLIDENFTVSAMLFWRFFSATLWIIFSSLIMKKNIFKHSGTHFSLMKTILYAAVSYSTASALYFMASKHIGTGAAMVIFFSYPVFVTLFAWVLSSWRMNKYAFASLIAVVIGLVFLKGRGENALDLMGIVFAMGASLFYATYVYGSQHSAKNIDSSLLTLLICLGNAVIFFAFACYNHTFVFPVSVISWVYIWSLGVFATALPIQLLLDGLKYVSPIKASILSVFEPVVTVLLGLALLNETMSYTQSVGVMIVLLGAILIQFERTHEHT